MALTFLCPCLDKILSLVLPVSLTRDGVSFVIDIFLCPVALFLAF